MKCFYHADLDGHAAGAIIKKSFLECEMIKIDYDDEFPWETIKSGESIFMVDFCLQPFSDMIRLNESCGALLWFDHHKSAIEESEKHDFNCHTKILRDGMAGCEIVWDFYYPNIPDAIKLIGRYDVWDHSDPRTIPFQYGMKSLSDISPDNQVFWDDLIRGTYIQDIISDGRTIHQYEVNHNKELVEACAFEREFEGYNAIAINKIFTGSKVFDSIYDPNKHDIKLTFGYNGNIWKVSLYTDKNNVDVSKIAKKHGGGGHQKAAGFSCKDLPFNK